jgi:hypothetical protein
MKNEATILCINENLDRDFKKFTEVPESAEATPTRKVLPYFL